MIRMIGLGLAAMIAAAPAQAADTAKIEQTIKAEIASLIAGLNAHDAAKATAFDMPDVISMEAGRPSSVGVEEDKKGYTMGFTYNPDWTVSLVEARVDV